jgi:hypothetical protein
MGCCTSKSKPTVGKNLPSPALSSITQGNPVRPLNKLTVSGNPSQTGSNQEIIKPETLLV